MRGGPGQAADAYAVLVVSAAVRPFRRAGLTIEDTASYRQEARLYDFDLFANLASARYDYSGSRACLTAGYGFETMTLGSELYAIGHVAQASARARLAGGFGLDAGYTLADRTYYPNGYAPYTGPTHGGLAGIDFRDRISLSYVILRELTVDPGFVATAQGARLQARTPLGAHADGAVTAWAIARLFDGGRRDTQLHADASLVLDLTAHVGFVVGASVLRNLSTDGDYDYLKVTAHAGIDIGLGVP